MTGFMKGRFIGENLSIDFEKAFDSLEWSLSSTFCGSSVLFTQSLNG